MSVLELVYEDLTSSQQQAILEILKSKKMSRGRLGPMLTINLILPKSEIARNFSDERPSLNRPQADNDLLYLDKVDRNVYLNPSSKDDENYNHLNDQFPELLALLGKLRYSKSTIGNPSIKTKQSLDKTIKAIDAFLDDKKTVISLQRVHSEQGPSIAEMVFRHFKERCRLRSALETSVIEFAISLKTHRPGNMQVDTFARLLSGEFDCTDLLFYKYVRSLTKTSKGQMTYGQCIAVSKRMFGQEQEAIHIALEHTLNSEIEAVGAVIDRNVLIETQFFVYIAVWVFHHQRKELGLLSSPEIASIANNRGSPTVNRYHTPRPHTLTESPPVARNSADDIDEYIESIRQYREATKALKPEQTYSPRAKPQPQTQTQTVTRTKIQSQPRDAAPVIDSLQLPLNSHSSQFSRLTPEDMIKSSTGNFFETAIDGPSFNEYTQMIRSVAEEESAEGIESTISAILLDSCRKYTENETHAKLLAREADAVMQIVMNGDKSAWDVSVRNSQAFDEVIRKRNDLLSADLSDADSTHEKISCFCEALAEITVQAIHHE